MNEYLEVKKNSKGFNCIRVRMDYDLGGYNYFEHTPKPRGYYLYVTPMERHVKDGFVTECFTAFKGYKMLIKEVKRKSAKAEKEALALAEALKNDVIQRVLIENELELA